MCTVSLIARRNGYALGMNRDEKLARAAGLPPAAQQWAGRTVLCPSEPGEGTWIGVNDTGATLALINWYAVPARVLQDPFSRGHVVKAALASTAPANAETLLASLPLCRVNPFRLIGVFPRNREVMEWRWDLRQLQRVTHPWRSSVWISSGHDEPGAQQTRGKTFREALRQKSAGTIDWLRRLHRSHSPVPSPCSFCMHRDDAATVSYTEVVVSSSNAAVRYTAGAPCCGNPPVVRHLALRR